MDTDLSPRLAPTAEGWAEVALGDPEALLSDHAHCEKKAAAVALSLLGTMLDDPEAVMRLARLAEQETEHLRRVLEGMRRLGFSLQPDRPNTYARALRDAVRHGRPVDRLLCAAMIEARSHERLELLRGSVEVHDELGFLAPLFDELAACEAGHAHTYVVLATRRIGAAATARELRRWEAVEADAIAGVPHRCAVH
ncbi:MAG: tRNA-(ms[2]io[6]A)-hydroxylase [Acidimicrobiia bacterium]|nr:tRNA-(ms[2]io[6]A)-hydroxylase [Acidimicrobiia bacterium]